MKTVRDKLKNACLVIDGSEWHDEHNRCVLKAEKGRIDIISKGNNLKVRRIYETNSPWNNAEIELKNVADIDIIEEYHDNKGIIATNKSGEHVSIRSYWVGDSYEWGPHWHAYVAHLGKEMNVVFL